MIKNIDNVVIFAFSQTHFLKRFVSIERKSDSKKNESEKVTYGCIDMLWSKWYIQAHSISIYQSTGYLE